MASPHGCHKDIVLNNNPVCAVVWIPHLFCIYPVMCLAHAHIVEQELCIPVDRPLSNSCFAMQELKQSNASYQLDFSIIMVRRQLARAAGVLPEDETALLHSQIAELSARVEQLISEGAHMARSLKEGSFQLGETYRLP